MLLHIRRARLIVVALMMMYVPTCNAHHNYIAWICGFVAICGVPVVSW